MTPLPDEQPLSRRQLREQQRTTDATGEIQTRRVSTTSAVPGGEIPEVSGPDKPEPRVEPTLTADEVSTLEQAAAEGSPLTRRQARDLERVRTASVTIVPPLVEPADPSAKKPAVPAKPTPADAAGEISEDTGSSVADSEPAEIEPAEIEPAATKPGKKPRTKKTAAPVQPLDEDAPVPAPASSRMPSFVPASAAPSAVSDAPKITGSADDAPAKKRTSFGLPVVEDDVAEDEIDLFADDDDAEQNEPQLSSSFGEAVLERPAPARKELDTELEQPFDQIIARGLEEAGSGVGTSSLILPSMPTGDPFTGPLTAQGGVVVTGSIDIPSNGSSNKHPNTFDKSDIDSMFDEEDEARPATAGTPVSASRAVSTHTATRDVITPPAPARSNRLLLILAITAGVLAVAVLSVIIVGIAAGAFQSR